MAKYNKLLIMLLTLVIFLVGGLSVYAYQKQQSYVNNFEKQETVKPQKQDDKIKKSIEDKDKEFSEKTELQDKIKIYEEILSKKDELDKLNSDELKTMYEETTDKMKKNILETVDSIIKDNTLVYADQLVKEKLESSVKKLEELKTTLNEKAKLFYDEQQILIIVQQIDTLVANYKFNIEQSATQAQVVPTDEAVQRTPNNNGNTVVNNTRRAGTEVPRDNSRIVENNSNINNPTNTEQPSANNTNNE